MPTEWIREKVYEPKNEESNQFQAEVPDLSEDFDYSNKDKSPGHEYYRFE